MSTQTVLSAVLTASYKSSNNAGFAFAYDLPRMEAVTLEARTAYLGALKKAITELQETTNKELTKRMDEDIQKCERPNRNGKLDESKEEENYGEEIIEED